MHYGQVCLVLGSTVIALYWSAISPCASYMPSLQHPSQLPAYRKPAIVRCQRTRNALCKTKIMFSAFRVNAATSNSVDHCVTQPLMSNVIAVRSYNFG